MSRNNVPWLVSVVQPSGIEIDVILILDKKPTRIHQKLKTLTHYIQQHPSGWKKRLELAELLYQTGCWQEAIPEYRQVIQVQPQLIAVQLKLASILQFMGQPDDAVTVYKNIKKNIKKNRPDCEPTCQHINGLIAICTNDIKTAVEAFESAAALQPENASHWLALGRLHREQNHPSAALSAFNQILSIHPDDVGALIHSYDALMTLGKTEFAEKQLDRLIELAPDDFRVLKRQIKHRCRIKLVWEKEGKQTKRMITSFRRQITDGADVYELLADYHLAREELTKARELWEQFLAEHPNNRQGWHGYKRCLLHIEHL